MPSKVINQDGKVYTFKPGKDGSLTAPADPRTEFNFNRPPVAKVVPTLREMRRRRYAVVGGARG